jgi:hypothetical protein
MPKKFGEGQIGREMLDLLIGGGEFAIYWNE